MSDDRVELASPQWWGNRLWHQIQQGPRTINSLTEEFAAAMSAAVDEHIRNHREKVTWGDAHASDSESPQEAGETPHRISAQSMIIRFMNGAEEIIHCHHPMVRDHGWTFRELNGIPYLVIGHAVPRRQYPLCNIAFIELSGELL